VFESVPRDLACLCWVGFGWQLNPHPAARSFPPQQDEGENRNGRSEKNSWVDKDSLINEEKGDTSEVMQRQSPPPISRLMLSHSPCNSYLGKTVSLLYC